MRTLHAIVALPLTLAGLACSESPRPTSPPARPRMALHLPWAEAGLSRREAAAHLLSRFSFGARPGEIERVAAMGPDRWFAEQLAADLPEPGLAARLAACPALGLPESEIVRTYPNDGMVRNEAKKAGAIPADDKAPLHGPAIVDAALAASQPQTLALAVILAPLLAAPPDPAARREKRVRAFLDQYARSRGYHPQRELSDQLAAQKLLRAVYADNQLAEVMTDFWFNHFNVSQTNDRARPYLLPYERDAIRPNALGRFRTLLGATARHPAMLLYLDNAQSVAPSGAPTTFGDELALARAAAKAREPRPVHAALPPRPPAAKPKAPPPAKSPGLNENYAREVMELHTLGVDGGYTQRDVVEVARAFTGWTVVPDPAGWRNIESKMEQEQKIGGHAFERRGEFLFRADTHDAAPKVVLGHPLPGGRGIGDGEEVLDLLAVHRSTARHLATQLAVRFVSDHPPRELVDRLAGVYTATGGDLRRVLAALAESPEFWRPEARGAKIKSPFELAASALRALGAEVADPKPTLDWVAKIGEPLYAYQAPTGYPDRAEAWVNTGSLLARMSFGLQLAAGRIKGVKVDLAALDSAHAAPAARRSRSELLTTYAALLLPEEDPGRDAEALAPLLGDPALAKKGAPTPAQEVVGLILGSPAFQRR